MSENLPPHVQKDRSPEVSTHGRVAAAEEIYEILLTRVLTSELQPGDRVTIDALCRELNVSQTPIREALHRLSANGIVVRTHMAGYRVAPTMGREQFEDLVEVRLLLEPTVARRAAQRARKEDVVGMRELSAQMADRRNDRHRRGYAAFSRLDTQFHDELARISGNDIIRDSLRRLHTHAHLFRLANNAAITDLAVLEHEAILAAIALADGAGAAYAMKRHIEASAERFRSSFEG